MDDALIEQLSSIRGRPSMYVGGRNGGALREMLHGLIREQLDAADAQIDEVRLFLEADGGASVELRGKVAGMTHSILSSKSFRWLPIQIAAALCEKLDLEVMQNDFQWRQRFEKGLPSEMPISTAFSGDSYMRVRLRVDRQVFTPDAHFGFHSLCGKLQDLAICHPRTRFSIEDRPTGNRRTLWYPQGLRSYMEEIEHAHFDRYEWTWIYELELTEGSERAEVVIFDRKAGPRMIHTFVNGERCLDGGTHVIGLENSYRDVIRETADPADRHEEEAKDVLAGLTICLAVQLDETPWASSFFRHRLGGARAEELVSRMVRTQLPQQLRARFARSRAAGHEP